MRTDFNDPNAPQQTTPPPQKKPATSGCFSLIFYLMGLVTIVISVIGYILSFFDMVLEIQGSKLPLINLEIFIPLMVCAVVFILLGWLFSKMEAAIRKRKLKKQG